MSLYPDNVPRANRVQQLAADIARIQSQIKEEIEDGRVQDEKAIKVLGEIAKKSGYQTLEEYEDAAFKLLKPEERAKIENMKKEVTKLDHDMGISHIVFRGLIAVGVLLSGAKLSMLGIELATTQMLVYGLQAVLRAIYQALAGATQAAARLFTWGRYTLEALSRTPQFLKESDAILKSVQKGGNFLLAIGVLVDAGLLIAEAIKGGEQRRALREAIKTLCSHRFIAKQLQQEAHIILCFRSDSHGILTMKSKYEDWIKAGRETRESSDADLKKMYTLVDDLKAVKNEEAQSSGNLGFA
ncbi:hypothetical protein M413DRAFT_369514 [Hebeloma cylindrosporum]|uniref:Uncharacterized protein n=1 Tax=Hebeloma cylindrosporum TaxID=76867 RepID=A0A0C3BSP3_HEBCY|nr:hypothetical protein M413DRAFT_369514 [Hebeloma cylindrosporum h7]